MICSFVLALRGQVCFQLYAFGLQHRLVDVEFDILPDKFQHIDGRRPRISMRLATGWGREAGDLGLAPHKENPCYSRHKASEIRLDT